MSAEKRTIRIESILGGHAPMTHFAAPDQFRSSLAINPSLPITDSRTDSFGIASSGLLRPVASKAYTGYSGSRVNWLRGARGTTTIFVYDNVSSAYTITPNGTAATALSDAGTLSGGEGNGLAYYDNYIYFATATNITRYGPLDGVPGFVPSYWTGTLGKTALTNTAYPTLRLQSGFLLKMPNHVMHRHSDGRLYIADVVDNKGTIHFIQTTKTTVEGDTDNGSTYNKVQVGYGLVPTCLESYGSDLAIALYERSGASSGAGHTSARDTTTRAKIAFWDTTATNVNKITWVEFPDQIITAMKNLNGILYVFSSSIETGSGFRVSRFVGGYSFEEVYSSGVGNPPFPSGVDGTSKRLIFGSKTVIPENRGCVYSLGLENNVSSGLYNVASATGGSSTAVIAVMLPGGEHLDADMGFDTPIYAWDESGGTKGIDYTNNVTDYNDTVQEWWSQMYRIGQPFKITKIRIPLAQAVAANMTVTPKIYTDEGYTVYTLTEINNTNDSGLYNIVRRSDSAGKPILGQHNFWLELRWTGSALCVVGLPITIEYELIED